MKTVTGRLLFFLVPALFAWPPLHAQSIRVDVQQSISGQSILAWNVSEFVTATIESDRDFSGYFTLELTVHGVGDARISSGRLNFTSGSNVYSNRETNFHGGQISPNLQKLVLRTGKFPGCKYTFRVELYEGNPPAGTFLASDVKDVTEECETDESLAPELVYPAPDDMIIENEPVFIWNSTNVSGARVTYKIRVCEKPDWQEAAKAIESTPLFEEELEHSGLGFVVPLQYKKDNPLEVEKLVDGRTYVWQVTALDENKKPVGSESGESELGVFKINLSEGEEQVSPASKKVPEKKKLVQSFSPSDKFQTKLDLFLGLFPGGHVFSFGVEWDDTKSDALFYMVRLSDSPDFSNSIWKDVVKAKAKGRLSVNYPESADQEKLLPGLKYYLVVQAYNKKNKMTAEGQIIEFEPRAD